MLTSVKITKKGQVTIPKKIREKLNTEVVEFGIEDGKVVVKPIRSVSASLKEYAKTFTPFKKAREKAWEEVVHERYGKKTHRR